MTQQPWRPMPPPMPPRRPRRGAGFILGWIFAGVGGLIAVFFMFVACVAIITPSSDSTGSTPAAVGPQKSAPAVAPLPAIPAGAFGDGTYRVGPGHDIMPGRYRTAGSGSSGVFDACYWERNTNDSGTLDAIIANDNFNGPASVTVSSGEFLKVSGGCVWAKAN